MRKLIYITFSALVFSVCAHAQKNKDAVLLTINNEPVRVSEFKRVYEKNLDLVEDEAKDVAKNLDLFINYKLKVNEAYQLKLDTAKSYQRELKKYKQQLIAPYLRDKEFEKAQIKEAYNRTKEEVRASHILLLFPKDKSKIDTIVMINELKAIKKRIEGGESFAKVAKEVSQDPSAKKNGGDLGYFSAFRMVYPFENAAYKHEIGEVSEPFKTRFGYHILQVTDKRPSVGEFKVAHILVKAANPNAESKIKEAYQKIKNGEEFGIVAQSYSDDTGSKDKGGVLPKFGTGRMVPAFEKQVLTLKNPNDVSEPFQTRFGWHIAKLLKKYPIASFEKLEPVLTKKIKNSSLGSLSEKKVIEKLKTKYNVVHNEAVLDKMIKKEDVEANAGLFNISDQNITVADFKEYTKAKRTTPSKRIYSRYFEETLKDYFKKDLEMNNIDFKYTLNEYKDGLLLFDLMQQKVWDKSSKDEEGLQAYFEKHKSSYDSETLEPIKGKVINDYQKYLEDNWIEELRAKNNVMVKKKVLKKFKANYK